MRRVVLILLVLALAPAPASASASWYRCAFDGVMRAACCCPAAHAAKPRTPALRAACCCTVTQITRGVPPGRAADAVGAAFAPAIAAAPAPWLLHAAPRLPATPPLARPRGLDPPDTLLSRCCALLL